MVHASRQSPSQVALARPFGILVHKDTEDIASVPTSHHVPQRMAPDLKKNLSLGSQLKNDYLPRALTLTHELGLPNRLLYVRAKTQPETNSLTLPSGRLVFEKEPTHGTSSGMGPITHRTEFPAVASMHWALRPHFGQDVLSHRVQ